MLSLHDQLTRENHNEQICRQLLNVAKQDQAMKSAFNVRDEKAKARRSLRNYQRQPAIVRLAYAALITLLTVWLAAQVAVAAYDLLNSGGGGLGVLFR